MTKDHKILNSLKDYDFTFDSSVFAETEFSGKDKLEFLQRRGYKIKQVSYTEIIGESDEFNASKRLKRELIALKPGEKIDRKGDFYVQNYTIIFKKEMKERMKELLFI